MASRLLAFAVVPEFARSIRKLPAVHGLRDLRCNKYHLIPPKVEANRVWHVSTEKTTLHRVFYAGTQLIPTLALRDYAFGHALGHELAVNSFGHCKD
jgi:hypothetical protein